MSSTTIATPTEVRHALLTEIANVVQHITEVGDRVVVHAHEMGVAMQVTNLWTRWSMTPIEACIWNGALDFIATEFDYPEKAFVFTFLSGAAERLQAIQDEWLDALGPAADIIRAQS